MRERDIGQILPFALELALLSERVVYTLSQDREPTDNDKIILQKAHKFLEQVLRGEEAVGECRLSATSTRDIRSYRWGLWAYESFVRKRQEIPEKDLKQVFTDYQSIIEVLCAEQLVDKAKSWELQEFFETMLQMTTRASTRPIEKVNIRF